MQDTRQIEILIKGGKTETTPKEQQVEQDNDALNNAESNDELSNIIGNQVFEYMKNELVNIAQYEINKHYTLADDYKGRQSLGVALNITKKAISVGTSIYKGFQWGGPLGAAVVAVEQGITLSIQIAQNYETQRIELQNMEFKLSFSRERAGYSLTDGSVGRNK